jgi:hypothetical protein
MYAVGVAERRMQSLPRALKQFRTHAEAWPLFEVMRQDDNANTFVIATGLCSAAAEAMVQEYTSRGHKQVYWCRPIISSAEVDGHSSRELQSHNDVAKHNCK